MMKLGYVLGVACCAITMLCPPFFSYAQSSRSQGDAADEDDPFQQPLPPGIRVRAFIHRPRVVEPNHLGQCTPDTSDPTTYGLTGWHLSGPIIWRLNPNTVPASIGRAAAATIQQAFDNWQPGIATQGSNASQVKAAKFDGINVVMWKRLSAGTIGVTYVWYYTSSGEVAEVDTLFNSRFPWAIFTGTDDCQNSPDAYDLENIATHELGHWIGLDDRYGADEKDLTMYGFGAGGEIKKRTLERGDRTGKALVLP